MKGVLYNQLASLFRKTKSLEQRLQIFPEFNGDESQKRIHQKFSRKQIQALDVSFVKLLAHNELGLSTPIWLT